jgi:hypothetical protein
LVCSSSCCDQVAPRHTPRVKAPGTRVKELQRWCSCGYVLPSSLGVLAVGHLARRRYLTGDFEHSERATGWAGGTPQRGCAGHKGERPAQKRRNKKFKQKNFFLGGGWAWLWHCARCSGLFSQSPRIGAGVRFGVPTKAHPCVRIRREGGGPHLGLGCREPRLQPRLQRDPHTTVPSGL